MEQITVTFLVDDKNAEYVKVLIAKIMEEFAVEVPNWD